jgi:hypothetical protein
MRLDVLIPVGSGLALWKAIAPSPAAPAGPGSPGAGRDGGICRRPPNALPDALPVEILPRVSAVLDGIRRFHVLEGFVAVLGLSLRASRIGSPTSRGKDRCRTRPVLRGGFRLVAAMAFCLYAFAIVATAAGRGDQRRPGSGSMFGWPLMAIGADRRLVLGFAVREARPIISYWCWRCLRRRSSFSIRR